MKKLQMLLFSAIFLATGLSFAQDGTFSRANNKAPNAQALGRYIIDKRYNLFYR